MEYIALCASLFLKNALISERKFVTLCTGIGLSFLLFCHYKDTHFLQQTEIPMPFLCTNTSYYCQLAKLEYVTINDDRRLYNSAYYCHVFSNFWMENFVVSGTINSNGISFLFNNFNISNPSAANLLSSIYKTLRDERPKLVSGEVYVCGRFGDVWRGMKIIKR